MTESMSRRDFLGASLALPLVLAATPVMARATPSGKKIRAEQTLAVSYPSAVPKNWVFYLPRPVTIEGYQNILSCSAKCLECPEMVFKEVPDSLDQRLILIGSIEGKEGTLPTSLTVVSTLDAILYPVNGAHGPTALTQAEKLRYTKPLPSLDFTERAVQEFCRDTKMVIRNNESISDFGRRVTEFVYDSMPSGSSQVIQASRIVSDLKPSDCGPHGSLPVAILRANRIPSRMLPGRLTNKSMHVKCEVFEAGLGWIPFDATYNVFANHNADHFATCIDTDLTFPNFPFRGRQVLTVLQSTCYYVQGSGSTEGKSEADAYTVTPLP
jgi:hypothetical protein